MKTGPMQWPRLRRRLAAGSALVLSAAALTAAVGVHSAAAATRVANPYSGATPYLNTDYVSEVQAQASADGSSAEAKVASYQTAIWMDHIGAIAGDSTHLGLQAQLDQAEAQAAASANPVLFEVVVYDLPGRDCAALASNGEIPATDAGLTEYESQYIDPIAALLGNSKYSNLRISAIIEPDSLPNAVTNQSKTACATATPYYEKGVAYALNKLHAIPNVYNYLDIGHSGWLGWSSNMSPAAAEFAKVARATTAGVASVDGFISDTANTTPTDEPFLPNSTLQVGGQPLDSANFYQYNPYFDEHSYDEAMHAAMVSAGFPSSVGMLIDTSRNGWGGAARPTSLNSSPTNVNDYVTANKIDKRPFRGDWCNVNGAGIGNRPTAYPYGTSDPVIGFVWIKPPGESDGDYPTSSHTHGDPHCDPNGTQTDGNGGTYPTDAIPGYDVPAGQWFAYQFQQLVANAYPALGSGSVDTTPPSTPANLAVSGTTSSSVSLTWSASTDNVGVTGYNVYRGSTLVGSATTTSFTDTGLSASTAYSYTVKAKDAAGNLSAASSAVSATTQAGTGGDTTPPSAPANLAVSGTTSSSVSLTWSASTDNVGVTGYNVYRGSTLVGSATTTSFTDTGLSASTAYSYTVKAKDAAGNLSAASSAVSATTQAGTGGTGTLKVQYKNNDSSPGDNQIKPGLQLVNTGTGSVSLSTVTIRYWFTSDGGASTFTANCDYAAVGCGNVSQSVTAMSSPKTGADHYLQVSFTGGSLAAGASSGDIQSRLNKTDWSNFTETNDYSYGTNTSYADASKITVYVNGTLVYGTEP
ncbi:glycoside hydrolase family 6 protein [Actinacidiphila acididurans]|uniref:Glucanase n=1 Tax=Actinacidiphila acididurans TaxID=2784346 RepID=A0ABS2TLX0_9ACTN|nr:glycoside hydrolase family 6 protein [Actinacidiphila acididurans]MBM9502988.1 glycoside hydrolase family 6 protein [Actinacidiphila acididurans]